MDFFSKQAKAKRNAPKWDRSNGENGREKKQQNEMKTKNSFMFDVWLMLPEIDVVRNRLC